MKIDFKAGGIAAAVAEVSRSAARLAKRLPPKERPWLNSTVGNYAKELARLRRRARVGAEAGERAQARLLLTSFTGRFAALIRVADNPAETIIADPVSRKRLEDLANSFALDEKLPGTARLVLIPRGDKPPRVALQFGWQARAAHLLIADVLRAKGIINKSEFNAAGRGRDRAGAKVRDAILDGYSDWIVFDLANFYSSVGPKHLKWLGLPPKVIRHSVFANAEIAIQGPLTKDRLKAARHGLPIGAMLSGKIASGLIGRMLRGIPEDHRVWSYVDDVAICARSPAATAIIADAITKVVENNSAGPLAFKFMEISNATTGFSFLNYRFRLECKDSAEHVHIHPDKAAFKNFRRNLDRALTKLGSNSFDEKRAAALKYATRWRAAHPLWNANAYAIDNLNFAAEVYAADHGTIFAKKHKPLLGPSACIGAKGSLDAN